MMSNTTLQLCFILLAGNGQDPALNRTDDAFHLTPPAMVLVAEEVASQLKSGLTTTFRIHMEARTGSGLSFKKVVTIEIRYELWDEVFLVTTRATDSATKNYSLANTSALAHWWSSHQLLIARTADDLIYPVRISLEVIPFSSSEQNRAREWFSDALPARSGPGSRGDSGQNNGPRETSIQNVIVATSIRRKPLMKFSWKLAPP